MSIGTRRPLVVTLAVAVSLVVGSSSAVARPTAPPIAAQADYQLGGDYDPPAGTGIVSRDHTGTPAPGLYNICYINGFQTQPGQRNIRRLVLRDARGKAVKDPDWPGEYLYDISTRAKRKAVLKVLSRQLSTCAKKGFDAVEPDNLDSWTRSHGLLTRADAVAFSRSLIPGAHRRGLAIAQKNTADLNGRTLGFDFAVVEECQTFHECGIYAKHYGRRIIEIEYARGSFAAACASHAGRWSIVLRDRDLTTPTSTDYIYDHC